MMAASLLGTVDLSAFLQVLALWVQWAPCQGFAWAFPEVPRILVNRKCHEIHRNQVKDHRQFIRFMEDTRLFISVFHVFVPSAGFCSLISCIQHWRFLFWNLLYIVFLFEDLNYKLHRPFDLWLYTRICNTLNIRQLNNHTTGHCDKSNTFGWLAAVPNLVLYTSLISMFFWRGAFCWAASFCFVYLRHLEIMRLVLTIMVLCKNLYWDIFWILEGLSMISCNMKASGCQMKLYLNHFDLLFLFWFSVITMF